MTGIESLVLDVPDPAAAEAFYTAFGLGEQVRVRAAEEPSSGFRGYTIVGSHTASGA